jgi:hypothetical protein
MQKNFFFLSPCPAQGFIIGLPVYGFADGGTADPEKQYRHNGQFKPHTLSSFHEI